MKKNILFLLIISILFSCASNAKKPEKRKKFLKGFSTYYNTLFNAKDALNYEFEARDKGHKDNFYAPYIPILTYEDQPLGSDLGQSAAFADNTMKMASVNNSPSGIQKDAGRSTLGPPGMPPGGNIGSTIGQEQPKGATALQIAEAKALKAIENYSVLRKGAEQNKTLFDAYIIAAQSRIYQNKPVAALDILNTLFAKMKDDKRLPLARVYQGVAYAKMKDYEKANEVFAKVKAEGLTKEYDKIFSIYYAESLLDEGKKEAALTELDKAFEVNSNRKLKSRIAFLRGQLLQNMGRNDQARESFTEAYKYANNFEFEVKSQIEIAKTYNGKGDYEGAKNYLEGISKKGTYGSRKNEFYYALGLMANKAGKKEEAQTFFRKSLEEKVSDPQIRGLTFYEIGNSYLDKNDYIGAGAYYDSALVAMTYEPSKILLQEQSENIKKIAKNYYLIKKNDSILNLARMDEAQKKSYFNNFIAKLKVKEEKEEQERRRAERAKGFDTGDYNANSIFGTTGNSFEDFGVATKGFYFSNQSTVSKGSASFKQVWGGRGLSDNWRYSQTMATIEDKKNEALGISNTPNPRRYEPEFYIEKIPTDKTLLSQLKKDRDTASLGMGVMYQNYFTNTPLATKTLYDLVDVQPEEKVLLQALYEIFAMNYEKNPNAADRAKQILLRDHPYSSYAEFVRNPKGSTFVKSDPSVEGTYIRAFQLYEEEKFQDSKNILEQAISQYPKDALVPKLALLNAFNTGKMSGKEVMILQLEQIALNYGKTPEGLKAKEMLNYLKSELQFQPTDNKGNVIPQSPPGQPVQQINANQGVPQGNLQNAAPSQPPGSPNAGFGQPAQKIQQKKAPQNAPAKDVQIKEIKVKQ